MITNKEILEAQKIWGEGVVKIGSLKNDRKACEKFTLEFIDKMYAYEIGKVLFKPTKCRKEQFRPSKDKALSYFIAGENCSCSEDKGFALNPWTKVRFKNHDVKIENNSALAMGNYFFTDLDGNETMVEYTFGYKKVDGELKIDLHHSSLPFCG